MYSLFTLTIRSLAHRDSVLVFDVGDPAGLWDKSVLRFDVILNLFISSHDYAIVHRTEEH